MNNYYQMSILMLSSIMSTQQNATDISRKLFIKPMNFKAHGDFQMNYTSNVRVQVVLYKQCFAFEQIRYGIDFRHDKRTTIVPYVSDKYIYIEYVCHGRYPVTNFGIYASTYSMVVRSCKHVYVTLICPDDGKLPDYVPRNYQFECRFNCKRLRDK